MCQITKVHFVHRKTIRYNNNHSLVLLQLFPKIVHKQLSEECTFEKYHINHGDENIEINRIWIYLFNMDNEYWIDTSLEISEVILIHRTIRL